MAGRTAVLLRQSCQPVWLVSFRHRTKTPLRVAAIDVYVYASDEQEAAALANGASRPLRLTRRWWTAGTPARTTFEEMPPHAVNANPSDVVRARAEAEWNAGRGVCPVCGHDITCSDFDGHMWDEHGQ